MALTLLGARRARQKAGVEADGATRSRRLSSGQRMFLAIALGLLPLGLLGLYSAQQSLKTAAADRMALFNIAGREIAYQLSTTIASNIADIEALLFVEETGRPRPDWLDRVCEQAMRWRGDRSGQPRLLVIDRATGADRCSLGLGEVRPDLIDLPRVPTIDGDRAELRQPVDLPVADYSGVILYPRAVLSRLIEPSAALPSHDLSIEGPDGALALVEGEPLANVPGAALSLAHKAGDTGLMTRISARRVDLNRSVWLVLLTPVLMWILAAGLAWAMLVWIILRPMQRLQRAALAYQPGQQFAATHGRYNAEVDDLEDAFVRIADRVAADKQALDASIAHQQALTREVHHRVKNNLQIVASLINLHSRDAEHPDAAVAYRTIQRRVDALAVVHRNHFAAMEVGSGIQLATLLSEMQTTLQAPIEGASHGPQIRLSVDSVRVSQDVALPIAFLVTELVELAQVAPMPPVIAIRVRRLADEPGMARLELDSPSFAHADVTQTLAEGRHARVLMGLSRQLRQSLDHQPGEPRFAIKIATLAD